MKPIYQLLEQKESEENWTKFEVSIQKFQQITLGSHQLPIFIPSVRKLNLLPCLLTERTRLCRSTLSLVSILAKALGDQFSQLVDFLLPTVLKLTIRANKVYVNSAMDTLKTCIESAGCVSFIHNLAEGHLSTSKTLRIASMDCLLAIMNRNTRQELHSKIQEIETMITNGIVDSSSEVRDLCRLIFDRYRVIFEDRVDKFVLTLPETAKRYLKLEKSKSLKSLNSLEFVKTMRSKESINEEGNKPRVNMHAKRREDLKEDIARSVEEVKPLRGMEAKRAERSLTKAEDTPKTNNFGGAKRVSKQPQEPVRLRMQPAQRVVASVNSTPLVKEVSTSTTSLEAIIDQTPKEVSTSTTGLESSQLAKEISTSTTGLDTPTPSPSKIFKSPSKPQIGSKLRSPSKGQLTKNTASTTNLAKAASNDSIRTQSKSNINVDKAKSVRPFVVQQRNVQNKTSMPIMKTFTRPSKPAPLSKVASLTNLGQDLKSTDWSKRFAIFEELEIILKNTTDLDFKSTQSEKIVKLLVAGLVDGHFKVQQQTLECIRILGEFPNLPVQVLDQLLPRISSICYNLHQKTRSTVVEKCHACVDTFLKTVSLPNIGQAILNGLGSPSSTAKIRFGCIGFLASLTDKDFSELCTKPLTCKHLLVRITPLVMDSDPMIKSQACLVLNRIVKENQESVQAASSALKQSERDALAEIIEMDVSPPELHPTSPPSTPPASRSRRSSVVSNISLEARNSAVKDFVKAQREAMRSQNATPTPVDFIEYEPTPTVKRHSSAFIESPSRRKSVILNLEVEEIEERPRRRSISPLSRDISYAQALTPAKEDEDGTKKPVQRRRSSSLLPQPIRLTSQAHQQSEVRICIVDESNNDPVVTLEPPELKIEGQKLGGGISPTPVPLIQKVEAKDPTSPIPEKIAETSNLLYDGKHFVVEGKSFEHANQDEDVDSDETRMNDELIVEEVVEACLQKVHQELSQENLFANEIHAPQETSSIPGPDLTTKGTDSLEIHGNQYFVSREQPLPDTVVCESSVFAAKGPMTVGEEHPVPSTQTIPSPIPQLAHGNPENIIVETATSLENQNADPVVPLSREELKVDGAQMIPSASIPLTPAPPEVHIQESTAVLDKEPTPKSPGLTTKNLEVTGKSIHAPTISSVLETLDTNPDSLTRKQYLGHLSVLLKTTKITETTIATHILKTLLTTESMEKFTIDQILPQFETNIDPLVILTSVIECLNESISHKCFELANRTIPKVVVSQDVDSLLSAHIIEGLKSTKSNIRKAAFDLAFTMLQLRDEQWQKEFYTKVRVGAGVPRENIIRGMMENRLNKE